MLSYGSGALHGIQRNHDSRDFNLWVRVNLNQNKQSDLSLYSGGFVCKDRHTRKSLTDAVTFQTYFSPASPGPHLPSKGTPSPSHPWPVAKLTSAS